MVSPTSPILAFNFDAFTLAYSPQNKLLFSAGNTGVTVWKVASNLRLTRVKGSPFGGGPVGSVAVVRKGTTTFLYAPTAFPDHGIRGFRVEANGTLTQLAGSPFETFGGGFSGMAVVDDLLVANKAGQFTINFGEVTTHRVQADGSLVAGPRFSVDLDSFHPVLGRNGATAFFPEINRRRLVANSLDVATGVMTAAPGSPFALDTALTAGLVSVSTSDDLALLYDARPPSGNGSVQAARINTDSTLTFLGGLQPIGMRSPIVAGVTPSRTTFVTASTTDVATFRLNATTGALAPQRTAAITAAVIHGIAIVVR
jgi:hypothetical protein